MIFDTSFLILRVRGQEQLIDLRGPIQAGDNSIGGVVGIWEGQAMRKAFLATPVSVFESLFEKHLDHISITMVQYLLQEFWRFIEEFIEVSRLDHSIQLFTR